MTGAARALACPVIDRIDRALGRPADPMAPGTRNFFCEHDPAQIAAMAASLHWSRVSSGETGPQRFRVNRYGRAALAAYLRAHKDEIAPPRPRNFRLQNPRLEIDRRVTAESRSKAKYEAFIAERDLSNCLNFRDFLRGLRVRLASPADGGQA